uniref:Uncharacterized protein n=1 Tax=Rhizophagus clarus TaxID=94130 RepID=A0A140D0A7_9GLOM|nr:hypothetical protein [Rhizophagus clarus]
MGLNILKLFSVLSIFLFVVSAYHLAERDNAVNCLYCDPSVANMSINCADGFNGITTWDCSRSTSTNLKCTGNCTDCALMCMAPTQISWVCNCT